MDKLTDAELAERAGIIAEVLQSLGRYTERDWCTAIARRLGERSEGVHVNPGDEPLTEEAEACLLEVAEQVKENFVTNSEVHRYQNDVVFHDLVMRFRSYVNGGLGKFEDIIAAAKIGRKIHWQNEERDYDAALAAYRQSQAKERGE